MFPIVDRTEQHTFPYYGNQYTTFAIAEITGILILQDGERYQSRKYKTIPLKIC